MTRTITELINVAQANLLRSGGVDNWEWYSESLENHGYEPSSDEYEDAEEFLNALRNGGVDNWQWYDASLDGLYEYEEYLDGLENLDDADDIYTWQEEERKRKNAAQTQVEPAVVTPPESAVKIEGAAAQSLHQHIADNYPHEDTDALYTAVVDAGLWKRNTFTKEFEAALKVIKAGVPNAMEHARGELLKRVVKNGKLDTFIKDVLNK